MTLKTKPAVGIEPTTAPIPTGAERVRLDAEWLAYHEELAAWWPKPPRTVRGKRNESATGLPRVYVDVRLDSPDLESMPTETRRAIESFAVDACSDLCRRIDEFLLREAMLGSADDPRYRDAQPARIGGGE